MTLSPEVHGRVEWSQPSWKTVSEKSSWLTNISSDSTKGRGDFLKLKGVLKVRQTLKPYSPNSYFHAALSYPRNSQQRCRATYWEAQVLPFYTISTFFSSHFLFNLFPTVFHSTSHQNCSVQVTKDPHLVTPYSCFSSSPSLSSEHHSTVWQRLLPVWLWWRYTLPVLFLPVQLFLLRTFSWFLLLYSNSYYWRITDHQLGSSSFLSTLWLRLEVPTLASADLSPVRSFSSKSHFSAWLIGFKLDMHRRSQAFPSPTHHHVTSFIPCLPIPSPTPLIMPETWESSLNTTSPAPSPPANQQFLSIHPPNVFHAHPPTFPTSTTAPGLTTSIPHLVCSSGLLAVFSASFLGSPMIHSCPVVKTTIILQHPLLKTLKGFLPLLN